MGKLVRDKIPEIIRRSGRTPRVTTLDEQAYRTALYDKLREEAAELRVARRREEVIDELADLLEVVVALAATHDVTLDAIIEAARRKRADRGGFEMRLWLEDTDPEAAAPWS
jgi:predicted house-cleaning noncanonical NTP pyrophosphatase (MazG superfamily)